MKNKCEEFYSLLSCQDNTTYLEYICMLKQIGHALSNIPSLNAANKN